MPFTFAHPAAILPFRYLPKRFYSLTGLIIGSMAPDFEKFMKMEGGNSFSHSWGAIFWFCIPLSIVLSFLFHLIVRDPLTDNLPGFLRRRFALYKKLDWKAHFKEHYAAILISIAIGAATHLLWDSFTHKSGANERQFPFMAGAVTFYGYKLPVFAFLNVVSSAAGMLIVLIAVLSLPTKAVATGKPRQTVVYWPLMLLVFVVILAIRVAGGLSLNAEILRLEGDFWDFIISLVSAGLISLLLASFITRYFITR